jgi:hypothetical protein
MPFVEFKYIIKVSYCLMKYLDIAINHNKKRHNYNSKVRKYFSAFLI